MIIIIIIINVSSDLLNNPSPRFSANHLGKERSEPGYWIILSAKTVRSVRACSAIQILSFKPTFLLRHFVSVRSSYMQSVLGIRCLQIQCATCWHSKSPTPRMPRLKSRWHTKAYQHASIPSPRCTFSSTTTSSSLSIIMLHHSECASNHARIFKSWRCRKNPSSSRCSLSSSADTNRRT